MVSHLCIRPNNPWLQLLLFLFLFIIRSDSWLIPAAPSRLSVWGNPHAILARAATGTSCRSHQQHPESFTASSWVPPTTPGSPDATIDWCMASSSYKPVNETLRWCYNFVLPLALCPWTAASLHHLQLSSSSILSPGNISSVGSSDCQEPKQPPTLKIPTMQFFTVPNSKDMEQAVQSVARHFRDSIVKKAIPDPSVAIFFVLCEDRSWDFASFYDWFCTMEESEWDDDSVDTTDNDDDDDYNNNNVQNQVTLAPFHPDWMFDNAVHDDNNDDDDAMTTGKIRSSLDFEKKSPYPTVTMVWTDIIDAAGPAVTSKIAIQNEITLGGKSVTELTALYQEGVYDNSQ